MRHLIDPLDFSVEEIDSGRPRGFPECVRAQKARNPVL